MTEFSVAPCRWAIRIRETIGGQTHVYAFCTHDHVACNTEELLGFGTMLCMFSRRRTPTCFILTVFLGNYCWFHIKECHVACFRYDSLLNVFQRTAFCSASLMASGSPQNRIPSFCSFLHFLRAALAFAGACTLIATFFEPCHLFRVLTTTSFMRSFQGRSRSQAKNHAGQLLTLKWRTNAH